MNDLEKKNNKYNSVVEEMRRFIRVKGRIRVYFKTREKAFEELIKCIRTAYKAPNKDFSKIGTTFMISKEGYLIKKYVENKNVVLYTENKKTRDLFYIEFTIKKTIFTNKYFIEHFENTKSHRTVWGLQANLAKWWYKRKVKENRKIFLKIIKAQL